MGSMNDDINLVISKVYANFGSVPIL